MSNDKNILPQQEAFSISRDKCARLLSEADGNAALLYLHILHNGGTYSPVAAAAALKRSVSDIEAAFEKLSALGLVLSGVSARPAPADEIPQYSVETVVNEMKNGEAFKNLVQEVQSVLGKQLSAEDLTRLFGIYDYLGMPAEVIYILVNYCARECAARYGAGRKPTMRQIEKTAFVWERDGAVTVEAAEAYLTELAQRKESAKSIAAILQIRDRAPSKTEKKYIDSWARLGISPELIELAYDKTIINTGRLAWSYLDSILKSWHEKGLRTPDDIVSGDKKRTDSAAGRGPDSDDIERMKRLIEKMKEG